MPLRNDQIAFMGTTPHPWEQDAIDFIRGALPDTTPYLLWGLFDLTDAGRGALYECDALILGYNALYLVEIKSHPARFSASSPHEWRLAWSGGRSTSMRSPLSATNHKAKVLASLLGRELRGGPRPPFVEPLIFLSAPEGEVRNELRGAAGAKVVTRSTFVDAIVRADYPSARAGLERHRVDRPTADAVRGAMEALGITRSSARAKLGELRLETLVEEGVGYQDWRAKNEMTGTERRIRNYLMPANLPVDRKRQLRRAANREAAVLTSLGDHAHVLECVDAVQSGPLGGPALTLEHHPDAVPLDRFLAAHPALSFDDRLELVRQVAEALAYCHNKAVFHRGLCPRNVLVRRDETSGRLHIWLYNFQLSLRTAGTTHGTVHLSAMSEAADVVYQAPELLQDPTAAGPQSDIFSLGALTWAVMVGRAPGASLSERLELMAGGYLSLSAALDGADEPILERADAASSGHTDDRRAHSLEDVVGLATMRHAAERWPSVAAFQHALLDALTTPTAHVDADEPRALDPLEAGPGAELTDALGVLAVLGTGQTGRVLQVSDRSRPRASYALKIAREPGMEHFLEAEAQALRDLDDVDHVVRFVDSLHLAGRACFLMDYAGESLADYLRQEGVPPLDYAQRWGEQPLRAVAGLEERSVIHRDIKPGNVGVRDKRSGSNLARDLTLFDFSLHGVALDRIAVGTPAYRDPFLEARAQWDGAADRYSAAATLYEMLTGDRARLVGDITEPDAAVAIRGERFDASVRDALIGFFECAFHRDVAARFASAEAMGAAWAACFAAVAVTAHPEGPDDAATEPAGDPLANVTAETPVDALPLSTRARNALTGRAGALTVAQLMALPRNQLSAVRGVGANTVREILQLVKAIEASGRIAEAEPSDPFAPAHRHEGLALGFVDGVDRAAIDGLRDAGLGTVGQLAAASRARVVRILQRILERVAASAPRAGRGSADAAAALAQLDAAFAQGFALDDVVGEVATTLEAWRERLLPDRIGKKKRTGITARRILGIEPIDDGEPPRWVLGAFDFANAKGKPLGQINATFGEARAFWNASDDLETLIEHVVAAVESQAGATTLGRAGDALLQRLPAASTDEAAARRLAAGLVCLVCELQDRVELRRPAAGEATLQNVLVALAGSAQVGFAAIDRLAAAAQALAAADPLASPETARERLGAAVAGTALAAAGHETLARLAVDVAPGVALSARLELYPRGMSAARALAHSAQAVSAGGLGPDELIARVKARYPAAEPLPERPALEGLVAAHGLVWRGSGEAAQGDAAQGEPAQGEGGVFVRPDAGLRSSTRVTALSRHATRHTRIAKPRQLTQAQADAAAFERNLEAILDARDWGVLTVEVAHALDVERELARRFPDRLVHRSLDAALFAALDALVAERMGGQPPPLEDVDRAGPDGAQWKRLTALMDAALERVVSEWVANADGARVILVTDLGLVARYGLDARLQTLFEKASYDDACPGVVVLLPVYRHADPYIDTSAARDRQALVPVTAPGQRMAVPRAWIGNRHRA